MQRCDSPPSLRPSSSSDAVGPDEHGPMSVRLPHHRTCARALRHSPRRVAYVAYSWHLPRLCATMDGCGQEARYIDTDKYYTSSQGDGNRLQTARRATTDRSRASDRQIDTDPQNTHQPLKSQETYTQAHRRRVTRVTTGPVLVLPLLERRTSARPRSRPSSSTSSAIAPWTYPSPMNTGRPAPPPRARNRLLFVPSATSCPLSRSACGGLGGRSGSSDDSRQRLSPARRTSSSSVSRLRAWCDIRACDGSAGN